MGASFSGIVVRGVSPEECRRRARELGYRGFRCLSLGGDCWGTENLMAPGPLEPIAAALTRGASTVTLEIAVHDDVVLQLRLFERGELIDEYNSHPGYFDASVEAARPVGGDSKKFVAAFGNTASHETVERIFRVPSGRATMRLAELLAAVGVPSESLLAAIRSR